MPTMCFAPCAAITPMLRFVMPLTSAVVVMALLTDVDPAVAARVLAAVRPVADGLPCMHR